jgi:hypothetical protein
MAKKQLKIPGTEREVNKEIEALADKYQTLKEKRTDALTKEIAAKGELFEAMRENKLTSYRCEESDLLVTVVDGEPTIKVKHVETDEEAAEALSA